ncbi:MAG: recombinase family protein, partial [Oscillospiraceae bacterium]
LCLQGLNMFQIANSLCERRVLIPTAYKSVHGVVNRKFAEDTKFSWNSDTVSRILANRCYAGDTVNGKTTKKSFKIKKRIDVSPDEWQIVPDTHEAIIDRDTWELVQKIRQGRRRNVRHNYQIPILSGHLFCADCGSKLYYVKPPKQAQRRSFAPFAQKRGKDAAQQSQTG